MSCNAPEFRRALSTTNLPFFFTAKSEILVLEIPKLCSEIRNQIAINLLHIFFKCDFIPLDLLFVIHCVLISDIPYFFFGTNTIGQRVAVIISKLNTNLRALTYVALMR